MKVRGEAFAVGAALANATIGILSRSAVTGDGVHIAVAALRCNAAWLLLTIVVVYKSGLQGPLVDRRVNRTSAAVLAFFGLFILYYFETWAFSEASVPFVTFLVYSCGCVTVLGGVLLLREIITVRKILASTTILLGAGLVFCKGAVELSWKAGLIAMTAGLGYSVFILLWKRLKFGATLNSLWWFFGFGSFYLSIAWLSSSAPLPSFSSPEALASLVGLVVIPTLGGYALTGLALDRTEAGRVQLIETSEPVFASAMAFVCFGEKLNGLGFVGALLVLVGLLVLTRPMGRRCSPRNCEKSR